MSIEIEHIGKIKYENVTAIEDYKVYHLAGSLSMIITKNGKLCDFGETPAVTFRDGGVQHYNDEGKLWKVITWTGEITTYLNGELHSYDDKPARLTKGYDAWYQNVLSHRMGGPAFIGKEAPFLKEGWWEYGKKHRVGGPAIVNWDGTEEWWTHGVQVEKPAAPVPADQAEFTYKDGRKGLVKMVDGLPVIQYLKHDPPQKGDWELNAAGGKRYWCTEKKAFSSDLPCVHN